MQSFFIQISPQIRPIILISSIGDVYSHTVSTRQDMDGNLQWDTKEKEMEPYLTTYIWLKVSFCRNVLFWSGAMWQDGC